MTAKLDTKHWECVENNNYFASHFYAGGGGGGGNNIYNVECGKTKTILFPILCWGGIILFIMDHPPGHTSMICTVSCVYCHPYPSRVTLFVAEAYTLPHSGKGCCGPSKGDDAETIIPLNTLFGDILIN